MIGKPLLIADSGGTKTDWCFVDSTGLRKYFTTSSFHPVQWGTSFRDEFFYFWQNERIPFDLEVHFFGAGCSSKEKQDQLKGLFNYWGFEKVSVGSDLLGAGLALYDELDGYFAILGTGSVCCKYESKSIKESFGGFGSLIGDEGSGYYFGKILLNALFNNEINPKISNEIYKIIGIKEVIIDKVYGIHGKSFISSLSFRLKEFKGEDEIFNLHKKNFNIFFETYLLKNNIINLSIIGSYAFHHKDILEEVMRGKGVNIKETLCFPISKLTDCLFKASF